MGEGEGVICGAAQAAVEAAAAGRATGRQGGSVSRARGGHGGHRCQGRPCEGGGGSVRVERAPRAAAAFGGRLVVWPQDDEARVAHLPAPAMAVSGHRARSTERQDCSARQLGAV